MRVLSLDLGDKSIGLAVSDLSQTIAQGIGQMRWSNSTLNESIDQIRKLLSQHKVKKIVVGLPKNMKGEEGWQAKKVRSFVRDLSARINIPIILFDERLSTAAAERVLKEAKVSFSKRKKVRDKLAATVILQNYLDSQKYLKDNPLNSFL
ncbi:putative pre-16S rRNA nuclease [subsurface metagenome]